MFRKRLILRVEYQVLCFTLTQTQTDHSALRPCIEFSICIYLNQVSSSNIVFSVTTLTAGKNSLSATPLIGIQLKLKEISVHGVESIFKSWPLFLSRMKSKIQLLCSKEHAVGPYTRRFYLKSQQLPGYSEIRTVLWNLSVHHRVHINRPHHQLEYPALNSKPCL